MPENHAFETLAIAIFGGTFLTVLSRKYALPTIVFLFLGGLLLGPSVLGLIDPNSVESILPAMVSLAIGIILFEGGLTLEPRDYVRSSRVIKRLLSVGAIVTWLGSALAVKLCFNPSWEVSLLAGSLVIVTGPTVIIPMLRRMRLKTNVASILHWEGVMIDAVGVFLAVLCFELVVYKDSMMALTGFAQRLVAGVGIGVAGGYLLQWILQRSFIPESLTNPFVLASAVFIFAMAEFWIHESGLLSATIAGIIVGRRQSAEVKQITSFKAELSDLLIGALFILLVSRLEFASLLENWQSILLAVALVMFVVRPLNIWISSFGSDIGTKEKLFLSWVAPRGIVAASMASLFALQLSVDGTFANEAKLLENFTFSVIAATVILQGLTAGKWAQFLGVSSSSDAGWMLVGAHHLGRELARTIQEKGVDVLLVDTNPRDVAEAKAEGLNALEADAREVENITIDDRFTSIRNMLALTDNNELNEWIANEWRSHLGKDHVFAWKTDTQAEVGSFLNLPRPSVLAEELHNGTARIAWKTTEPEGEEKRLFSLLRDGILPWTDDPRFDEAGAAHLSVSRTVGYLRRAMRRGGTYEWDCQSLQEVYEQIATILSDREPSISRKSLLKDLIDQERILPPFLGHGIAAPHAYSSHISERICMRITLKRPISVENQADPIQTVYFILSPAGDPEGHLATLAEIAKTCHEQRLIDPGAPAA